MIIKQQSFMNNPFGLLGALVAIKNKCYNAWWAGDEQYSVLEFDYGLSIKIRKPIKNDEQLFADIDEIINHCMPNTPHTIERDGDFVRAIRIKKD